MAGLSNIVTRIKALITADNKDFKMKMDETQKSTKKTGTSIKNMGGVVKAIMGGVVVAAVAKAVKSLIGIGKQMDLMDTKATAVFGRYKKEIEDMAETTASSMGMTETEFINAAAGIQDLLIPIGFAREEATGMTKDLVGLSGALSTWTGGMYSAEDVSNIFAKALLGEREQLKSLGIAISEAEVQQRLLEKGMKGLTGEALAQAKAQATMELITEKSTDAQVAFNDAQDSLIINAAKVSANLRSIGEHFAIIVNPAIREGATLMEGLTSQLADVTGGMADVADTDMSIWDKLRFGLAKATGGFAGMAMQQGILQKNNEVTESQIRDITNQYLDQGKTLDDVTARFSQYGDDVTKRAKMMYSEQKALRERDEKERQAAAEERIAKQRAEWAEQVAIMRENLAEIGVIVNEFGQVVTEGFSSEPVVKLAQSTYGLKTQMDTIPDAGVMAALGVDTFGSAAAYHTSTVQKLSDMIADNIDMQMVQQDIFNATASTAIAAARDEEASFESVARAALNAARDVLVAAMVKGVASAVASALEGVPFPWNLAAAAIAGVGAAVLFETLVPSFAEGGMVTGPTLAMVGDNPSGKELMIPWEKIGELSGAAQIEGIIKGSDLHLISKRYNETLDRVGRGE